MRKKNIEIGKLVESIIENNLDLESAKQIVRSWQGDQIVLNDRSTRSYSSRTGIRDLNRLVRIARLFDDLQNIAIKLVGVSLIVAVNSKDQDLIRSIKTLGFRLLKELKNANNISRLQFDLVHWHGNHLSLLEKFSIFQ